MLNTGLFLSLLPREPALAFPRPGTILFLLLGVPLKITFHIRIMTASLLQLFFLVIHYHNVYLYGHIGFFIFGIW